MEAAAIRDLLERDKNIVELRALLASYEQRLSGNSHLTPQSHAARAHMPEPLFLVGDIAVDLRSSALESCPFVEAPAIIDCTKPAEPEPFSFIYKVKNGVFRVHPRKGVASAAVIGPLPGPAPTGLLATVQTTHGAAPSVRFHISSWLGEIDSSSVLGQLDAIVQQAQFLTVPPRHPGYLISTASPRRWPPSPETEPPAASSEAPWGLVLVTVADPPEEIGYAWAEFSDIVLMFSSERGSEIRLLS